MRNWGRSDRSSGPRQTSEETPLPGVIDTLGFGYAALAARPLIMLPLLVLDLLLLFAPRVRLQPTADTVASSVRARGESWGDLAGQVEALSSYNVVEIASLQAPLIRTPALVPSLGDQRVAAAEWYTSFSSLPMVVPLLIALVALAGGVILSVVYRMILASGAQEKRVVDMMNARAIGLLSLRFVGWIAALLGLAILISMPVIIAVILGQMFGFTGSELLILFLLVPMMWGFVHFYFSIHALFVDRSGPFESLRASYKVVHRHFWQSVQFIATTMLISTGLTYALQAMAENTVGILLATTINAFVASGIIVAAMLFYRDRARRLGLPSYIPGR
jgi:hypothetical protein